MMLGGSLRGGTWVDLEDACSGSVALVLLMLMSMLKRPVPDGSRLAIEDWRKTCWCALVMKGGEEQCVMCCLGCGRFEKRCGDELAACLRW
jgi:hypothetical protein